MATVVVTAFVVGALYLGRDVLIPIALAALLTFLLSPLVTRLERWIGRVAATLLVVATLFGVLGGLGWVLAQQMFDLAERLPDYQQNIQTKLRSLKMPGGERFARFNQTLDELKKELPGAEKSAEGTPANAPANAGGTPPTPGAAESSKRPGSPPAAMPVEIVASKHAGLIDRLSPIVWPLLGPIGTAALVILLLFCMLLQRENLRGRLIQLIGSDNISATTHGMDDASHRVARFLVMQLIVNATYGVVIGTGLYFIGVPNAILWAVLTAVLRFIPYVGPWIAAFFPIVLSLAVTNNWTMPALTIGLFVVVELLSNNVMEPWLYGASTGVSPIALIIAAVFWTWLWGPVGLVLSTPLTVCLAVMGRHVPRLGALSVVLSDEEALSPPDEFYHRLLTPAANDATEFAEAYLKENSLIALYDGVFIPALASVARDAQSGELDEPEYAAVLEELRDLIEDLGTRPVRPSKKEEEPAEAAAAEEAASPTSPAPATPAVSTCGVLCLPVRAKRDEIAGAMLVQVLAQLGFKAVNFSGEMTSGELLEKAERETADAICISVTPPSTIIHARYLCRKLRTRFPKTCLVVGLWGVTEQAPEMTTGLREFGADEVVTSLADAIAEFSKHAGTLAQEAVLLAPTGEGKRVEG